MAWSLMGCSFLCAKLPRRAFCFSRLHATRLCQQGLRGEVSVLGGEYAGSLEAPTAAAAEPLVVFAGRFIPEKGAPLAVAAFAVVAPRVAGLKGEFYGDGPEREALLRAIEQHGLFRHRHSTSRRRGVHDRCRTAP